MPYVPTSADFAHIKDEPASQGYQPTAADFAHIPDLPDDDLPESFMSKLPRNIGAGLAQLGHSTINAPHDLVQLFERQLQSMGGKLREEMPGPATRRPEYASISSHIPQQQEYNFAEMLGQKGGGTFSDRLIQKGVEHSPELIGVLGLARAGMKALPPLTQRGAARKLAQAEQGSQGANIALDPELIEQARRFLPNTRATEEMLARSAQGEYAPSFSTQSQIGHHERALRKSPLAAERLQVAEAQELKKFMLSDMEAQLRNQGYHKEADLLRGGINDYRRYIHVRDKVYPVLKKLGIPTGGLTIAGLGLKKAIKSAND